MFSFARKQMFITPHFSWELSDEYKPDGDDDDDDDESCSSGVDENELADDVQSEEDIEEDTEKVIAH